MKDTRIIIRETLLRGLSNGKDAVESEATLADFAPDISTAIEWCKYRIRKEYPDQTNVPVVVQWVIDEDREKDVRVYVRVYTKQLTHVFTLVPRDRMSIHKMGKLNLRTLVTASTIRPGAAFTPDAIDAYPDLWISDNTLRIMNRLRNTEARK